jgi:2-oxoglutarate ferredoxin oxidoreductase subunit gamma
MMHEIIMAGFGGQGVMTIGKILAKAALKEGKNVSWMPSYGPEMRGGTANCSVKISEEEIGSPFVTGATAILVMNKPSLDKFETVVQPEGALLMNSSLIDRKPVRSDIKIYDIPANEIADGLGNNKVANMVMLGAYLKLTGIVGTNTLLDVLEESIGGKSHEIMELNKQAVARGAECIS